MHSAAPPFSSAAARRRLPPHPLPYSTSPTPQPPPISAALSTAAGELGRRRLLSSMADAAIENRDGKKEAVFDSEDHLAVSVAKYTAEIAGKFAAERGAFSVVLSCGLLVKSMRKLLEEPYVGSIEWAKWHVFWVDERVVPKDHEDCNDKFAYDGFLSKLRDPQMIMRLV